MIGKVIGALVGSEIERKTGGKGVRGALTGAIITSVASIGIRRMGPIGIALGGVYVAKKILDRSRAKRDPE